MDSWQDKKDEEILWASRKNPKLFAILVDRYQAAFLRAAGRILKNQEESEDVVQDSFVKIYRNAARFRKEEGIEFKSWAYRIVINTALSAYRKLKRRNSLRDAYEEESLENIPGPQRIDEEVGLKHLVHSVLEELPEETRTILAAHYLEDKSYETISREEKISVAALKTRLHRARKAFQAVLNNNQ
jgi:RNA polymerase sigma-70 factor (ECF subfamily)